MYEGRILDDDGYPTDEVLEAIKRWPHYDFDGLMELVGEMWAYKEWGWTQDGDTFKVSTAGWSGNESIIEALRANLMFWTFCWVWERRGGHFEFELPGHRKSFKSELMYNTIREPGRMVFEYNPNYGDGRTCECGHTYISHFDLENGLERTDCKYCGCGDFREAKVGDDGSHCTKQALKDLTQMSQDMGLDY